MPLAAKLMPIAWPAFLSACVLQAVVFAVVDPTDLALFGHPLGWSRQAIYSTAFFLFWVCSASASFLTSFLKGGDR